MSRLFAGWLSNTALSNVFQNHQCVAPTLHSIGRIGGHTWSCYA